MNNGNLLETKILPNKPGVYYFSGKNNKILYIGKAKDLYKRTRYYFQINKLCLRLKKMVSESISLDYYITDNENEAFLLEAQLIKQKQPIYNIQYKHGRALSYIIFTNHSFPQVKIIKEWQNKAIGPFLSYCNLKKTIDKLLNFFQIRTCSDFSFKRRKKPCLEYYAKKCSAPCVNFINISEYMQNMLKMRNIFLGKNKNVLKELEKELKRSVKEENFETSIQLIETIRYIKQINEKQSIFFEKIRNIDVALFSKNVFYLETISNGAISHIEYRKYNKKLSCEEILHEYYIDDPKKRIIGDKNINFENYSNNLNIEEKNLLKAAQNRFNNLLAEDFEKEEWAKILKIEKLETIEAYDCSHYNSKNPMCGCVKASVDGEFIKNKYKLYKLDHNSYNDLEILENGLKRRKIDENLPDLILIDGGITQLSIAKKNLDPYKNIIAYAKGEHRKGGIVYDINGNPIIIENKNLLLFLENLRSAAHNWVKNNASKKFSKIYEQ